MAPIRASRGPARQAFTLVELLVVVAIIAMLVTILLPTLSKAREMARQSYCLMNQSGIAKGLGMYSGEYGFYPYNYASGYGNYATTTGERWAFDCLARYVGGSKETTNYYGKTDSQFPAIYRCPSADLNAVEAYDTNRAYLTSYWTNIAIRLNAATSPFASICGFQNDGGGLPGEDGSSSGHARINSACPACPGCWRSVYEPRPAINGLALSSVGFSGDTRNTAVPSSVIGRAIAPGEFQLNPNWTGVGVNLGIDRHQGKFMMSYLDGHAKGLDVPYLLQFKLFTVTSTDPAMGATGDFMLKYNIGCTPYHDHSKLISKPVVN